jgi:hypothetical protein
VWLVLYIILLLFSIHRGRYPCFSNYYYCYYHILRPEEPVGGIFICLFILYLLFSFHLVWVLHPKELCRHQYNFLPILLIRVNFTVWYFILVPIYIFKKKKQQILYALTNASAIGWRPDTARHKRSTNCRSRWKRETLQVVKMWKSTIKIFPVGFIKSLKCFP